MQRTAATESSYKPRPTWLSPRRLRLTEIDQVRSFLNHADFENWGYHPFFNFSPKQAGTFGKALPRAALQHAGQAHDISMQNFALCAIADRPPSPPARLGCRFVCTTSRFAQKNDANPVGGRGISAFSSHFFFGCNLLSHADFSVCIVCISL